MFQTFISRHNSNFFSDKLVLTSVTPASSAPVLQTPKATSSTLYFDSLTVNAGNGGFLHCIQMDTSVNAANQVVSVGADIAFDADPKFFACLVRFDSSSVPTNLPTAYDVYPFDGFFFSSRRRHTRCSREWSSDVCSSDLGRAGLKIGGVARTALAREALGDHALSGGPFAADSDTGESAKDNQMEP